MARPRIHNRAARLAALTVFLVVAAVAAVWVAPRVSGAVAAWVDSPNVEMRTATLTHALSVGRASAATAAGGRRSSTASVTTIDAGMRFCMVGVTCATPSRDGRVLVRLRTSEDGATWSRWYTVELERAAEEGGSEKAFTEPIWTGEARYVQVAARRTGQGAAAPTRLRDVRVVTINSTEDADTEAVVAGFVRRTVATIAGVDLTDTATAMTSKPTIVTRKQWGANESWRSGSPDYAQVQMAFVHHTDSGNTYTAAQAPAVVRGVYAYHTKSLHWSDIGYNFLIDRYGTIYEGRYGGVTRGVIGAQVLGFNTGSTGISVIGTFSKTTPTSKSIASLEELLAWKLDVHHVDPCGKATLVCGYGQKYGTGQRVTFPAIAGHRDANYTDCPGSKLYARLPAIRNAVASIGQPKIYGFAVTASTINPDGDGTRDETAIDFTVSQTASWRVEVRDADGDLVRRMSGSGKDVEVTWDGRDDDGDLLPDGKYTVKAGATSADGEARAASATVWIDRTSPMIGGLAVQPDPFSPNGDGKDDVATVAFTPGEKGTARVSVVDDDGTVFRRVTGWKTVSTATQEVRWDGRITSSSGLKAAPEGEAHLLVELRDVARNTASATCGVMIDKTLKLRGVSPKTLSPNGDGARDSTVVSFKLTRAADVVLTVARSGAVVRTLDLGTGVTTVKWDGRLDDDTTAASGSYELNLAATGALGRSSVAQKVTVDLTQPTIVAASSVTVRLGKTARLSYRARDAYSPTVRVSAAVTTSKGKPVKTLVLGWVKQANRHVCSWKPKARGVYLVTFSALDQGRNHEKAPAVCVVKVR